MSLVIAISNPQLVQLVDKLLSELDNIARNHDSYDYGLPLYGDDTKAQLRECVYQWLLFINTAAQPALVADASPVAGEDNSSEHSGSRG